MSTQEARAVLGLGPGASADEIRQAYHRLEQRLDPKSGGSPYLTMKINEARDTLLGA
jgi:curved DNA-binding protein CbpA